MLSTISQLIEAYLNSIKEELNLQQFKIDYALDPMDIFEQEVSKVWVVPVVTQYLMSDQSLRVQKSQVTKNYIVTVCISCPFKSFRLNDVANKTETDKVLNLRENIDNKIISHKWGKEYNLIDVIPEPPQEVALNERWFISVTEFTFQGRPCV